MIGNLILQECLFRDDVETVTTITRKPLGIVNSKLKEIIHNDFMDFSKIEDSLKNQDVCYYCIGVYTGQVPIPEFKKITVDYTKVFASELKKVNEKLTFCFLSGAGADSSEKSKVLFAREKGIAENYLLSLNFFRTYIFRPGYIYPITPRKEPNIAYKIMRLFYKPVAKIYPNIGVTSVQLAHKMTEVGLNGGSKVIYENKDLI